MSVVFMDSFNGAIPLYEKRLLPKGVASVSENCKFERGNIEAIREPVFYSYLGGNTSWIEYHGGRRLELIGTNVSFAANPMGGAVDRFFFTDGSGTPKKSSSTTYSTSRKLGVSRPSTPLSVSGPRLSGTNIVASVSYVYTFVTDWGEESAPSPPTAVFEVYDAFSLNLSGMATSGTGVEVIAKKRIYRINAGTAGAAYQFVAEVGVTTTSYVDTKQASDLGEVCQTEGWIEPPGNIGGLTYTGNGCIAGFNGNTIYISEPFAPYAFPTKNYFSVTDQIIGLGHFGQTLIALTTGRPVLLNGSTPESIAQENIPDYYPCVSARSIVSSKDSVYFASHNGLFRVSSGGIENMTEHTCSPSDWASLNPSLFIGVMHEGKYHAFVSSTDYGYIFDFDTPIGEGTTTTMTKIKLGNGASIFDAKIDYRDSKMYLAATIGGQRQLLLYEGGGLGLPIKWSSGEVFLTKATNLGALRVEGSGQGYVTVSSDGTRKQIESGKTTRLSAASKTNTVWFTLEGFNSVRGVYLGDNIRNVVSVES